jgi:hypothetical protein
MEATNSTDPDATIAALLDDAIEDQGIKAETIAREFGKQVAAIVLEVTDDKSRWCAARAVFVYHLSWKSSGIPLATVKENKRRRLPLVARNGPVGLSDDVCSYGKTGSDRCIVTLTRFTHNRYRTFLTFASTQAIRPFPSKNGIKSSVFSVY